MERIGQVTNFEDVSSPERVLDVDVEELEALAVIAPMSLDLLVPVALLILFAASRSFPAFGM